MKHIPDEKRVKLTCPSCNQKQSINPIKLRKRIEEIKSTWSFDEAGWQIHDIRYDHYMSCKHILKEVMVPHSIMTCKQKLVRITNSTLFVYRGI